jgi:glycyl-tRNA synthetase beta chain
VADFLLEIGLEEIPARMIDAAREELARRVTELLGRERLSSGTTKVSAYSTPRRLALLVSGIASSQTDTTEQVTGPALKVAYKDGAPTPAAEAFAKKVGVAFDKLEKTSTPKGEYLAATVTRKGRTTAEILAEALPGEIGGIYWAKNMYWRAGKPERFVRPVRWIVALLDKDVVKFTFSGVEAGRVTRGHRILSDKDQSIAAASDYAQVMTEAKVIAAPDERVNRIEAAIKHATDGKDVRARQDDALLDTVVNLTEFPSVIAGSFEREYLDLPEEVLVTVMRDHQKYFAVENQDGTLAPHFLAVINTDKDADGLIRHGNERVLRARFNDARFFWDTDQKHPLKDRIESLRAVTFHKDLGSYFEKTGRISELVNIGGADFDRSARKIDRGALHEAAWLAKTDLTTELVKEFTELQGVVGGLYAKAQGHSQHVADAIYDHYLPLSTDGKMPRTIEGALLSIADKIDSVVGMFALGLEPSGSKDPFALRRQANGIVRIVAEMTLPLDLRMLFKEALAAYHGSEAKKKFRKDEETQHALESFFRERVEFYLRDVRGFAYDEVNAVLAADPFHIADAAERVAAVAKVRKSADFESISVAFKRIKNILRQAEEKKVTVGGAFHPSLGKDAEEKALADVAAKTAPQVADLRKKKDYSAALAEIARIRPSLDAFFDKVMVMVDDAELRANRLALLASLLRDFSTIADFSEIVTEKKESAAR